MSRLPEVETVRRGPQEPVGFLASAGRPHGAIIPAVAHASAAARIQTVHAETDPLYYGLLQRGHALTGYPVTKSFDDETVEPAPPDDVDGRREHAHD